MATINELQERRNILQQELESGEAKQSDLAEYKDRRDTDTRQRIARWFVIGYFVLFTLILIGVPVYNAIVSDQPTEIDLEGTLQIFGSIIGTSLGFVVGYYFKSRSE